VVVVVEVVVVVVVANEREAREVAMTSIAVE